jgi:hypothetical protein
MTGSMPSVGLTGGSSKQSALVRRLAAQLPVLLGHRRSPRVVRQRQVQHRLPPDKIAHLVADYQAGSGTKELALNYRIHRDTVSRHIKQAGVPFRQLGLTDEQKVEAERLYLAGWSLQRLADRYGRDYETIRRNLKKRGVRMRSPWERPH